MSLQDRQMLNELIIESREHLAGVEPDLLELEQKGGLVSDDLINRVFRAIHSIKGGFGFFGIEKITRLSHDMETALSRVRDKTLAVSSDLVDALLSGVDRLRGLLDDVDNAPGISIDEELKKLWPFVPAAVKQGLPKEAPNLADLDREVLKKHPDVTSEQIIDAVKNGKRLYQIQLRPQADIEDKGLTPIGIFDEWEKVGVIFDIVLDFDAVSGLAGSSRAGISYSVMFASVLEPDLISLATGVAEDQVHAFDTAGIRAGLQGKKERSPVAQAEIASRGEKTEGPAGAPAKTETHVEDALRVKVSLLNKLMNLAGELVLGRNQLLQHADRTIGESLDSDRLQKEFDRQVKSACGRVIEAMHKDVSVQREAMNAAAGQLSAVFRQSLNVRLADLTNIHAIMQNIDMVTSMLQESIMRTRLQPISVLFSKFPRIIRDLAKKCGKEVELELVGQEVELDKSIIELLSDPLTHLVRNSVDHGIEAPAARTAAGKDASGRVVLRAFHEGGKVNVQIRDDGAGINTSKVRQKAVEKGLVTAADADKMGDIEINRFILAAGFSTADKVTDLSGRGVGMDVVKTNIEKLGGTIDISSVFGRGTTITLQLPLTLAIISSLVVTAEGKRFAIPQVGIEELVRVRAADVSRLIERVGQSEVYRLRGHLLPLVRLAGVLGLRPTFVDPETGERREDKRSRWSDRRGKATEEKHLQEDKKSNNDNAAERRASGGDRRTNLRNAVKIVVLRTGENLFGLVVDEVFDSEEIVVKPLSSYFKSCGCYAGATIMGDGTVAMILDTNGLGRTANLKFTELQKENAAEHERYAQEQSRVMLDILLFDNGADERLGIDLSALSRIEKVDAKRIEHIGAREFVRYEKSTLPLIRLQDFLPIAPPREERKHQFVLVPKVERNPVGIAVGSVHDVIRAEKSISSEMRGTGVAGSMVLNERMTLIVDLPGLLEAAGKRS